LTKTRADDMAFGDLTVKAGLSVPGNHDAR